MNELIFKPRELNFPYHYNLCYYISMQYLYEDYFDPQSIINMAVLDTETNDLSLGYVYLDFYKMCFDDYTEVDGIPLKDFTETKEFTFSKADRDFIDNYPSYHGWESKFIDEHVKINLPEGEFEKIKDNYLNNLTNDFINYLIEKRMYIPYLDLQYEIKLQRRLKTKYKLIKEKRSYGLMPKHRQRVVTDLIFSNYQEAYAYAAMLYDEVQNKLSNIRMRDINDTIDWAVKSVPEEDREELRKRLSMLPFDNKQTILSLNGEVFYHRPFANQCYQMYPFDKTFNIVHYPPTKEVIE